MLGRLGHALLLLRLACALKVGRQPSPEKAEEANPLEGVLFPDPQDLSEQNASVAVSHLPPPLIFRSNWRMQMLMTQTWSQFPPEVQLVLGVFSMESFPNREFVHHVIKKTWMSQPGVCWLQKGHQPGCTVYTAFVLGVRSEPIYSEEEVVLNTSENMNKGKTFDWFRHAGATYPWATHIGKMDLDAFPYLHMLAGSLYKHMGNGCEHYVGRPWRCLPSDVARYPKMCAKLECGPPLNGNFLSYAAKDTECWSYMQGGLYIMSYGLAKGAASETGIWSQHKTGIEDVLAGRMVQLWAKMNGSCISTWDPRAYWHLP